jgi:hypothetical protein
MKQAISERKPLATTAGKRSLIFRGAITGVDSSKEGCSSMKWFRSRWWLPVRDGNRASYHGYQPLL